jgi:hypothetical protein
VEPADLLLPVKVEEPPLHAGAAVGLTSTVGLTPEMGPCATRPGDMPGSRSHWCPWPPGQTTATVPIRNTVPKVARPAMASKIAGKPEAARPDQRQPRHYRGGPVENTCRRSSAVIDRWV